MASKRRSGKGKSVSSKGKSVSGARKSGRRSTGRVRAASRKPTGHELVPVVCSECFEEFAFDTGVDSETLTCPVCEHSASRPDDGTLHRISSLRKAEKTNFMITAFLTMTGIAGFTAWAVLMRNPTNAEDSAMFWGPLGVSLLAALVLCIFIFKYEGNRWEVFF